MKHFFRLSILFTLFLVDVAQAAETPTVCSLASPYQTIITHLGNLQEGHYRPEIAAKAFSQKGRPEAQAIDLAVQLKKQLDSVGITLDTLGQKKVPTEANYIDPEAKYHKYLLTPNLPHVYLVPVNQEWIYSEETARYLQQATAKKWSFDQQSAQELLTKLKSMSRERWLAGAVAALLCCVGAWLLYSLLQRSAKKLLQRIPYTELITRPLQLIGLITLLGLLPLIDQLITIPSLARLLLSAIPTFLITVTLYQSVSDIAPHLCHVLAGRQNRSHLQLVPLMASVLKVIIIAVGGLLTLRNLNFNITPLLTSVSIGGIGFALASQDLFKNLFGSLVIFIDQPFSIGDTIASLNVEGKVEEIGLRSTRLLTSHNSVTYVPNAQLANTYVNNYGLKRYRVCEMYIELAYNTPPERLEGLINGLKKIATDRAYLRSDQQAIYLEKVHDATLQLRFCLYLDAPSRTQELQYTEEIQHDIRQLAAQLGVDITYST